MSRSRGYKGICYRVKRTRNQSPCAIWGLGFRLGVPAVPVKEDIGVILGYHKIQDKRFMWLRIQVW